MKIESPHHIYIRFEKGLKSIDKRSLIERVTIASLPYFALYRPFGQILTVGSSSLRTYANACDISKTWKEGNRKQSVILALKTAIVATALFASVFKNPIGMVLTTGMDIVEDLHKLIHAKNAIEATEALLHATASSLYLATMIYGSLEIIALSLCFQSAVSFFQSGKEFKKGRWIEGVSHFGMGAIKANQAKPLIDLVRRKWYLFRKFSLIRGRIEKSKNEVPKKGNPIENMSKYAEENKITITDSSGNTYDLGAYISEMGGEIVKGMHLNLKHRNIDGVELTEVEFKVNHVFREMIQPYIDEFGEINSREFVEFLHFSGIPTGGMKMEKIPFEYLNHTGDESLPIGEAYSLTLPGLGQILIGGSEDQLALYNRVLVRVEQGKEFEGTRTLLSLINIAKSLNPSTPEEIERYSINQLFHIFDPNTPFERSEEYFKLNIQELKEKIISLSPQMEQCFTDHLPQMKNIETLPGLKRMSLTSLGQMAKDAGAVALLAGIGNGENTTYEQACEQVVSILGGVGFLSSQRRFNAGMFIYGDSSVEDHELGSAESVFTRLLVESNRDNPIPIEDISLQGQIQLIIDTDVLQTGTYQYHEDLYGTKKLEDPYLNREGILTFIKKENGSYQIDNEVMIKDNIAPQYIKGCVVQTEAMKNQLIDALDKKELIAISDDGTRLINGIPLNQFIAISQEIDGKVLNMTSSAA